MLQVNCADLNICESIWVCHCLSEHTVPHAIHRFIIVFPINMAVQFSTQPMETQGNVKAEWIGPSLTLFSNRPALSISIIFGMLMEGLKPPALNKHFLQAISRSLSVAGLVV